MVTVAKLFDLGEEFTYTESAGLRCRNGCVMEKLKEVEVLRKDFTVLKAIKNTGRGLGQG